MEYIDKHPQGRVRLLKQFMLTVLNTEPVIKPREIGRRFCKAHKCHLPLHTAATLAKKMAAWGILIQIRKGQYCHAYRPVAVSHGAQVVLDLMREDPAPWRVKELARALCVTEPVIYNRLKEAKRAGLVRRIVRGHGVPIAYKLVVKPAIPVPAVNPFG